MRVIGRRGTSVSIFGLWASRVIATEAQLCRLCVRLRLLPSFLSPLCLPLTGLALVWAASFRSDGRPRYAQVSHADWGRTCSGCVAGGRCFLCDSLVVTSPWAAMHLCIPPPLGTYQPSPPGNFPPYSPSPSLGQTSCSHRPTSRPSLPSLVALPHFRNPAIRPSHTYD